MRRTLAAAAATLVVAVVVIAGSDDASTFEVDAVFDSARGIVPGQVVKIAGTRVGTVSELDLVRRPGGGYKARMTMRIERRFAPFKADASCRILPEGLISENYVECAPGSTPASLPGGPAGRPTIAVARTSASVSLQDVLDTFSLPTDKRIRLFLHTLGIGTAGRGEDINALLRRANPSLTQARRVLHALATQNRRISTAVQETDVVLRELAGRAKDVRGFVAHAASLSRTTATHRRSLGTTVRLLPPMLRALRGGLGSLEQATTQGTPLLADLRASAPQLQRLTRTVQPFAAAGVPAVRALGAATARGTKAAGALGPVVRHLGAMSAQAPATADLLERLLTNSRDRGAIEGFLRFLYGLASFSAPYDGLSHFVGLSMSIFPECLVANAEGRHAPGCSHAYRAPKLGRVPVNAPAIDPGATNSAAINEVDQRATRAPRGKLSGSETEALLEFLLG